MRPDVSTEARSFRKAPRQKTVPSPSLQAAALRAAATLRNKSGGALDAAPVADLLASIALAVHRRCLDPAAPIDERIRTVPGRGLLEVFRAELIHGWAAERPAASDVLPILTAVEGMRAALEPGWELHGPELLVEVAHDLRSPLTSILFLAETLGRGQSGEVNEVQRGQLRLIYGAALQLSSLASDVIELAQGGKALFEEQPVPLSVATLFESVHDMVGPIAEEKHVKVRLRLPVVDHRLGHPHALGRVLLNLTTNALKFTEEGFVEIAAEEQGSTRVEFAVRDSGAGMDGDWAAEERRAVSSGSRLGLAMCRRLLEAMGSELCVETRPGWGTCLYFGLDLPPVCNLQTK